MLVPVVELPGGIAYTKNRSTQYCVNQQSFKENLIEENIHRGNNEEQTEQVEPGGDPAPEFSTEDRAPVIQAASGGVRRRNLTHAKRDQHGERAADQPADEGSAATRGDEGREEGINASSQDTNDRKRNCKIREPAHTAREFLGVA